MNRLIIKTASPGACVPCGGLRQIRLDAADCGIVGVFPCPSCCDDQPSREFLAPLLDYLGRPTPVPPVIA